MLKGRLRPQVLATSPSYKGNAGWRNAQNPAHKKRGSRRGRQAWGAPRLVRACDGRCGEATHNLWEAIACFLLQLRFPKKTAALQPDLMSRRHPLVVDLSFQSTLERSNETESHVTLPAFMLSARRRRL